MTAAPALTFGWDTVFAVRVPVVNRAIIHGKSSPATFAADDEAFSVRGEFGDWQITSGGDGKEVRLRLPLPNVTLTYRETGRVLTFSGHAVVGVQLHYLPHSDTSAAARGKLMKLVIKDKSDDPLDPAFIVVSVMLDPAPGTVSLAVIEEALKRWGNEHLSEFGHIFTVVDLNRMVDSGAWGFVTPSYTSYAYLDGPTTEDSVFAVLSMTGNRTGDRLSEQISHAAIPSGSAAGFLLSTERMLDDVVRPAIALAYPGLTHTNFRLNDTGNELFLDDHVSIDLPPVVSQGTQYHPKLTRLTVKSENEQLVVTSFTTTEVAAGITANAVATHWYTLRLVNRTGGSALEFVEHQAPSIVHSIERSAGSMLTQLIIDIVGAIALLILTILTDGAVLLVGGLVLGLTLGLNHLVPAVIEQLHTGDSPSIDLLLANAVAPIRWPATTAFTLTVAALNVSLQLGGNFTV